MPTHDQSTAPPPATTTQEIQLLCKPRFSRTHDAMAPSRCTNAAQQ
jgi:hypothetical protein